MVILGLEHIRQYPEIVQHHEKGTIPPTVMWGSCPTVFDDSQAPAGKHTAFMWEKLPYHLNGDPKNWDKEKDIHGKRMLHLWTKQAPNLEHDVIDWFTRSALDTERTFPNMQEGDLLIGAFTNRQIGYHRHSPEPAIIVGILKVFTFAVLLLIPEEILQVFLDITVHR